MDVKDKLTINDNHSLEWGKSTWNPANLSIRNRYNTEEGKFNHAGSSEIPWGDFNLMIIESLKRNKFSKDEVSNLLKSIAETIKN